MNTPGDRLLYLMSLAKISNISQLADLIGEKGNNSAIGKATKNEIILPKRIYKKLGNILGWSQDWIDFGLGWEILLNRERMESIQFIRKDFPLLYANEDLQKYKVGESQLKPIEQMNSDELRGMLLKIMHKFNKIDREIAFDVVKRYAQS